MQSRKFVLVSRISGGVPRPSNFKLVEELLPTELQPGEILLKAEWLSMDPFIRFTFDGLNLGDLIPGAQVARVIKSRCEEFPVGSGVIGKFGWRDLTIYKPEKGGPRNWTTIEHLMELKGLSPSLALGALGMPGNTAYFGLLEVIQPKAGETILVSTASGAIGSLVGQIAKIMGCRVIGVTGSDEKADWLKNELGFDVVLNYKKMKSVEDTLKQHVPEGIDCYFDSVGGAFTYHVMQCMNNLGRIGQCGSMGSYNGDGDVMDIYMDPLNLRIKNLSVLGFYTGRWEARWAEGITHIRDWILEGKIKACETISEGFETTPQAFLEMFQGKNKGKQLVKV